MAEGGRTIKSSNDDDLLCCTVCMEEYEDPRALPCLHTFCFRCILQLSLKEGTISSPNVNLSSYMSQQKEVLKCPLCSEEHPVPKDKGMAGFRKDFRIQNLKERQLEIQTKGATTMVPGNEMEKCSFHPDQKLLYHCENESCKLDICEVCWSDLHDKHNVTLLSKKLKDARDLLRENVGKNMELIVSHLEMLSHTKKEISDHYEKVKNDMKQRRKNLTDHLNTIFDQRLGQLEKLQKIQVENILDEVKSASSLKDSFKQIQYNIDKTNILISSKTLDQYNQWEHQMSQTSSDLEKWNYSYSGVQLHSQKIQTLVPVSVEEVIEKTTTFSSYKVMPGELIPTKEAKKEEVRKPPEKQDTDDLTNLKYASIFRTIASVRGITFSENNLLYVVNSNCLVCYDTSSMKKRNSQILNGEASAIALIYCNTGKDFIAVLNNQKKMIMSFTQEQQNHVSSHRLVQQPDGILASCKNLLAYTFSEGGKAFVSLLSVDNDPPNIFVHMKPLQVPLESGKVRSTHLSISKKGNPVLVSSSMFLSSSTQKSDTAVVMNVIHDQELKIHWKMSFNELDSNISSFDLKSIACNNDYVFVLNSAAGGALYRITKIGKRVRKMKVIDKDFSFSSVNCMCLGSYNKMFMSDTNDTISVFNYS